MNSNGAVLNSVSETGTIPPRSEQPDAVPQTEVIDEQQLARAIERLVGAAQNKTVFGEPVVAGQYTIITACEVFSGGGFGLGGGPVVGPTKATANVTSGSGGGAGVARGRPIAVIIAGPDGVTVKPIVDVTRFMIVFFTTWRVVASTAVLAWRKVAPVRYKMLK